jgi:opacity protein-like surface antigen
MKRLVYTLTLLLLAAPAGALHAQGIGWTLTPKVGFFTPLTNLSETSDSESKLATALALGLSLELDFRATPLAVRANADIATNSEVESEDGSTLAADQLNLVGDLLFRPFSRNYIVQPYLLVGAGLKRYSLSDDEFDISTSEQMFTAHVGAGVIFDLGSVKLSAELSDYISSWDASATESKGQHDIFGMVGLRIPLN